MSENSRTQGSKIALVRSYLRVPQAVGRVKNLIFLVIIKLFPIYANTFCDAGQVPILRYFEAWYTHNCPVPEIKRCIGFQKKNSLRNN